MTGSISSIKSYHAHIYWRSEAEQEHAMSLRLGTRDRFVVELPGIHSQPIGPHLYPYWVAIFTQEKFGNFVAWLMLNRNGLSVLIHPNTGREMHDHTTSAFWLGQPLSLFSGALAETETVPPVVPNTTPHLKETD